MDAGLLHWDRDVDYRKMKKCVRVEESGMVHGCSWYLVVVVACAKVVVVGWWWRS